MGHYGSQNFKTLLLRQITFESFQTFSEISSQWSSQKYCFGFLKFWVFDFPGIFFAFTWDPMGAETPKDYSSLKSLWNYLKIFLNILPYGPHKITVWIFVILRFWFSQFFFSFSLTWYPMRAKTWKSYSSLKSLLNPFTLFQNFLLSGPYTSNVLDLWNFEFMIYNDIFFLKI